MKLNILVISHYFPPMPGVGGRRWTKFTKYLSKKKEINIHVISAKNNITNIKSSFESELNDIDFKHTTLSSNYPSYLERVDFKKSTLISKIMFRVQHYLIKKKVKGNYWDLSVFWKDHFYETIPEIIKSNQTNKLIISGPPYRYVEFACQLKNTFPELEIILDYRDPWNDFNNPKTFSKERHEFEISLEKKTLTKVDKIITVSDFQKSLILKKQPNSSPIFVIPNGFDKEDYINKLEAKKETSKINLTHFGTLHFQKDYYWIPFFNAYNKLKNNNPELYEKLEINLVGYCPKEISDFIIKRNLDVKIHGMMQPLDAFNKLKQADIALWFKYDGSPGDFATKFGDYVALEKFMWTFSVKGAVTEHIENNKIGKAFYRDDKKLENSIYQEFLKITDNSIRQFPLDYDSEKLDIVNLTNQLIEILK
jgi:glycosyltransferase involved in cell wall biosynthesis